MSRRPTALFGVLLFAALCFACPTRTNPDLPDGWDRDVNPAADADLQADGEVCTQGKILCDDVCVSPRSYSHCGDCTTQCDVENIPDCQCQIRSGDTVVGCWVATGHPTTYDLCTVE